MIVGPTASPDFEALRKCWHPVGYSGEFKEAPRRVQLLDQFIVIWRDAQKLPHAIEDMCIHRGAALSLGRVVGDDIACPYHGWTFGKTGVCTAIPQLEEGQRIPSKARVPAFHCRERYGLIWVAMEEPRWPLPEIPELESSDRTVICTGPYRWNADSSRQ
jgi:phenylpropionate dioxygenase-like ring-hydroxylating dioxygenase large terminal subunit